MFYGPHGSFFLLCLHFFCSLLSISCDLFLKKKSLRRLMNLPIRTRKWILTGNNARLVCVTFYTLCKFVIPEPPRGAELVKPYNGLVVRLAGAAFSQKSGLKLCIVSDFPGG